MIANGELIAGAGPGCVRDIMEGPLVNAKFERLQGEFVECALPQNRRRRIILDNFSEEPDAGHGRSTMAWSEHEIGGADHVER
jgi:hypothetical protein